MPSLARTLPPPQGLTSPHCGNADQRLFREQDHFSAYRCRACEGNYTLLAGIDFAKSWQRPTTWMLSMRGIANGDPTAHLARESGVSRKQLHTLGQRIQANLNEAALRSQTDHVVVCHDAHEWARQYDGDGQREVHCNSCERADAALRTQLHAF